MTSLAAVWPDLGNLSWRPLLPEAHWESGGRAREQGGKIKVLPEKGVLPFGIDS